MGRQYRTLPQGAGQKLQTPRGSTGGTIQHITNYGMTYITNSTAEVYVLDAPAEGVSKIIMLSAGASSAAVIRANTVGAQTVSFNTTGGNTILTVAGTIDRCIELIGINSTQWFIRHTRPSTITVASTYITASTT